MGDNFLKLGVNVQNFASSWVTSSDNLNENGAVARIDEVIILDKNGKKLQLNPANDLIIPLDKIFRNVFNPTKDKKIRNVTEDKHNNVKSVVTFETFKGSLNQFDKLVFCAVISEQRAGNNFFTIRRLWQKMGGSHTLTDEMQNKISDSIEKLACTRVSINLTAVNETLHYCDKAEIIFKNYLLPCTSIEIKLNGQIVEGAYRILDDSPLFKATDLKKQFTKQPIELLDTPKLHNSVLVMKLKFFLLERTTAIIGSHKKHKAHIVGKKKEGGFIYKRTTRLQKIITFEDIFEQCELLDATKRQKQQARDTIEKILNHFLEQNFISKWNLEKKNGSFYSIHFDFKNA